MPTDPHCKICKFYQPTKEDKGFCERHEIYDCFAYFYCNYFMRLKDDD